MAFNLVLRLGGGVLGGNFFPPCFAPLTECVGGGGGGGACRVLPATGAPFPAFTSVFLSFSSCKESSNSNFLLGVWTPGFSITAATSTTLVILAVWDWESDIPSNLRATSPSLISSSRNQGTLDTRSTSRIVVSSAGSQCPVPDPPRMLRTLIISSRL